MSAIHMLRAVVNERLAAAAEDIFGVFERTIEDYVEEIVRQRRILDVLKPSKMTSHQTDHLQLFVCEEDVPPEQQQRSLSLGQEDPEPPQIKEEHEELWTSQEGEQLQELKEAEFIFTQVHDNDNGEETSQFTQTQIEEAGEGDPLPGISTGETKTEPHVEPESFYQASDLPSTSTEQMKTEPEGQDCGVSEPASNFVDTEPTPDGQLLSSDCYITETDAWKETWEPQSGLNRWTSNRTQKVKGQRLSFSNKFEISGESSPELKSSNQTPAPACCKVCRKSFPSKQSLMKHVKVHPHVCGLCGKHLEVTETLQLHFSVHRKCKVCGKGFTGFADLERHGRIHTGEKPFRCTFCGKGFVRKEHLQNHVRIHTGEKPFTCTVCGKRFSEKGTVKIHMRIHTGAKPYSCGVCGRKFRFVAGLKRHRCRTGE